MDYVIDDPYIATSIIVYVLSCVAVCTLATIWEITTGLFFLARWALRKFKRVIDPAPDLLADEVGSADQYSRWRKSEKWSQRGLITEIGKVPGVPGDTDIHRIISKAKVDAERDDGDITVYYDPPGPEPEVSMTFQGETVTFLVTPYDPRFPPTKLRVADLIVNNVFPAALGQQPAPTPTATSYSTDLVDRLFGNYGIGPHVQNGAPEFGWRQFQTTPICIEAGHEIFNLRVRIARLEMLLEEYERDNEIT